MLQHEDLAAIQAEMVHDSLSAQLVLVRRGQKHSLCSELTVCPEIVQRYGARMSPACSGGEGARGRWTQLSGKHVLPQLLTAVCG